MAIEIQNSLIKTMAVSVIRNVTEKLHKSSFLAVMIDETTDVTNQEQVVIHTSENGYVNEAIEEFIGLYEVPHIGAATP